MTALQTARGALHGNRANTETATAPAKRAAPPKRRRTVNVVSDEHSADGATDNSNAGASASAVVAEGALAKAADRPSKPRTRAQTKPSKSEKRDQALLAGELESMLREAEDGLSAITIAKRSRAGYNKVLDLLRELESAGQVRRTGTRRSSLWRLITDEERIAQRAAELERLSIAKAERSPDQG